MQAIPGIIDSMKVYHGIVGATAIAMPANGCGGKGHEPRQRWNQQPEPERENAYVYRQAAHADREQSPIQVPPTRAGIHSPASDSKEERHPPADRRL